ncbi:MAG: hypothetical protein R6X02_25035 [Enhygromyxa sp.]
MTQPISKHLFLASTLAALVSGCLLKLDGLDAGIDESSDTDELVDDLECLIGTELDAVGVTRSSWDPQCEVTCAEGWGHDGAQLPIAWTATVPPHEGPLSLPVALGLLENGRLVVASISSPSISLLFLEPDGLNIGGFDVEEIGSTISGVEIDSHVLYIAHGHGQGTIELRAVDLDSQQTLWSQTFAGEWASTPARAGDKIAFVLTTGQEDVTKELVVLDLDGQVQWTRPTIGAANGVALSPSGDRLAVSGDATRIYAANDGELLDEFVHGFVGGFYSQTATFVDEDRVITVGSGIEIERLDGWLAGDSLSGDVSWERTYNRATSWCPDPEDDEWSASTAEWLVAVATLADGSLVAAGSENFEGGGVFGSHPWVARFSAEGEFLGSDRGLWAGYAIDTVAGPDGSVFVLMVDKLLTLSEDGPPQESRGFAVRKYVP